MKVLIYYNGDSLKPVGGPCGYLYNLKLGIDKVDKKNIEIDFLHSKAISNNKKIYEKSPILVKKIIDYLYNIKTFNRLINKKQNICGFDLNSYDVIHFHCTTDLFSIKDSLKTFKGKVLLTCHSPKPYFREIYEDQYSTFQRVIFRNRLKALEEIDKYAFEHADNVVFPCMEATEPYEKWLKKIGFDYEHFLYMESGIVKKETSSQTKNLIESNCGDNEDIFTISYAGRHNYVKGYDRLKDYFKKISNEISIKAIICGQEGPMYGLEDDNWTEIGWTNKAIDYINSSDVFILPNIETYFDLVLLEVISIGQICLISNTGGNKFFKKFENKGIFFFENYEDFRKQLLYIRSLSEGERTALKEYNITLFNNYFNEIEFAKRYIGLLSSL